MRRRHPYAGKQMKQVVQPQPGFPAGPWETRFVFDSYTDPMTKQTLEALCEGYTLANMVWMNHHPGYPCCLATAGVEYMPPIGCPGSRPCQTVRGAEEILASGVATCIDIACYYAASLRLRGIPAKVVVVNMIDQSNGLPILGQYHILVRTRKGLRDYSEDLIAGAHPQCAADCARPVRHHPAGALR